MTWLEWIKNMKGEDLLIGGLGLIGLIAFAIAFAAMAVRGPRITIHKRDDKGPWG